VEGYCAEEGVGEDRRQAYEAAIQVRVMSRPLFHCKNISTVNVEGGKPKAVVVQGG